MKKFLYIIFFTIVLLFLMILTFKIQLSNSTEHYVNQNISDLWTVMDKYDQKRVKTLDEFFSEDGSLKRLKFFNQELHENFNFLEYIKQPIEFLGNYSGDKRFIAGNSLPNQLININGESQYITNLNSIQLSEETWKYFNVVCDIGRGFSSEDYISESEVIPVVLGHDYKSIYDVGDDISCSYLYQKKILNVIGFLPSGTQIFENICDDFIIMPALKFSESDDTWDEMAQKILYSQKNNGKVVNVEKSSGVLENERIVKIANDLDLKYSLLGYSHLQNNLIYYKLALMTLFLFGVIIKSKKTIISYKQLFFVNIISLILAIIIFLIIYNIPNKEYMFFSIAYSSIFLLIFNLSISKLFFKTS